MNKEEIKKIIDNFNLKYPSGSISIELIDFDNKNLKLKFSCSDKTEFKVQGKVVTIMEESKKIAEKYIKEKLSTQGGKNINIILL